MENPGLYQVNQSPGEAEYAKAVGAGTYGL